MICTCGRIAVRRSEHTSKTCTRPGGGADPEKEKHWQEYRERRKQAEDAGKAGAKGTKGRGKGKGQVRRKHEEEGGGSEAKQLALCHGYADYHGIMIAQTSS